MGFNSGFKGLNFYNIDTSFFLVRCLMFEHLLLKIFSSVLFIFKFFSSFSFSIHRRHLPFSASLIIHCNFHISHLHCTIPFLSFRLRHCTHRSLLRFGFISKYEIKGYLFPYFFYTWLYLCIIIPSFNYLACM